LAWAQVAGSASSLAISSGPMPAGSPSVSATTGGSFMFIAFGACSVRHFLERGLAHPLQMVVHRRDRLLGELMT